ncbi:MAG: ABC transporter permease [Minwuia sp.]|uniref:ABC transporter permease n=1 Tax=Minwuia sp. TaxID=2493630 RepID=UPI003A8B725B
MRNFGYGIVSLAVLVFLWGLYVRLSGIEPFLLPGPLQVAETLAERHELILRHLGPTALEIVLGLFFGTVIGCLSALLVHSFEWARRFGLPVLVASQALPVFALAPVLVLWLGYGLWSKVAMATLIIFFPVATAFLDGLRRTDPGWVELARTMTGSRWAVIRHVRIPAALPSLGSGLRVAAGVAPIGAVVGEWVGSSAGLGYLMLHANGRMQIDLMFAALFVLAVFAVLLWLTVDRLLRWALPWQPDTFSSNGKD